MSNEAFVCAFRRAGKSWTVVAIDHEPPFMLRSEDGEQRGPFVSMEQAKSAAIQTEAR